jgi:uncharacterized integral membrane protein (TIGR00697 family)
MTELDLLFLLFVELICLFFASVLGREYLFASIICNLLLVSLTGAKLVSLFGFVTNAGNIFYAGAFIGTYLLIERGQRRDGILAVGVGFAAVAFFSIIGQLVIGLVPAGQSLEVSSALSVVLGTSVRVMFASMSAYLIAQSVNIWLYTHLRRVHPTHMWMRVAGASALAQALDSVVFFSIAFIGVIPLNLALQAMLVGFVLKFCISLLSIPLLSYCADKHCA